MGSFALIAIIGGILILGGLYLWSRQRQGLGSGVEIEQALLDVPLASNSSSAVLVATEHGQLLYINDTAQKWLALNGSTPNLEYVAGLAEPSDSFLDLFATEGQASFQLLTRWVEASSHTIPGDNGRRRVVVLRELTGATSNPDALDLNLAMNVVNQIGEVVNASMGMEQVLQLVLETLRNSTGAEAGEICLYHPKEKDLRQRGWVGDTRYLLMMAETGGIYKLGEGIVGWVGQHRKPALVKDSRDPMSVRRDVDRNPFESLVTVPLILGERFVGTLGIYSNTPNFFSQTHVALLQAVSKPITISIYNAQLYAEQAQRISDIASIQQISEQADTSQGTANIYRMLNKRIVELIDADMSGVFLYDDDRHGLVAQIPFHGLPDNVAQMIYIPLPVNTEQYDIWKNQPYWVSNDVVDEPLMEAIGLSPVIRVAGIHNTALIPLQISGERIGMIAVSNKRTEGGFTPRDIQSLRVLATQVAIVVENIRLYEREQRIGAELVGLQEMTHAIGALSHDEGEFYSEITERIARLMNSTMCGILLYDRERQQLQAQLPFFGVAADLVANYAISVQSGTVMEELWSEEEFWYTNRAQTEALVFEAGMDALAERVGVTKTMFAKLSAGGRAIGVVQVSNKTDNSDYSDADARLLQIFGTQAAAIIENARLYREVQRNADQAESLRRVAEVAGGILTSEQTFETVFQEIARITDSPLVFVNVLDTPTNSLITYPRWTYGFPLKELVRQDTTTPGFQYSVVMSGRPFVTNDLLNDERVLPGYRNLSLRYNIKSAIMVPLVVGDRIVGELGIGNRPKPYTDDDVALARTLAAQIAAAVDRVLLYEATGENLRRRVEELDAVSRVSNELATTVNLDKVLDTIRHETKQATKADSVTIALLMSEELWREKEQPELERRIGGAEILRNLTDIERESIRRLTDPVLVPDYERTNMTPGPIKARSAVAAPILYLDKVVAVIHAYHADANYFEDRAAAFLMTMSTKASLAYQNDIRYREQLERSDRLRRRVDQLNRIFELGQMLQTNADAVSILEAVAYSVQQSVGYDSVLMLLMDEQAGVLRRVAQAGMPLDMFESTKHQTLTLEQLEGILKSEFQSSDSYFFPIEKVTQWAIDGIEVLSTSFPGNRTLPIMSKKHWHDGDLMVVAVRGSGGNLIGLISVDRPEDNLRPDRGIVEVLEIFAHQASAMIENTRLFSESLRNTEQEARLNEVMEAVSSTLDLGDIAVSVAKGAQRLFPVTRMTVAVLDAQESGFDFVRVTVQDNGELDVSKDHRPTLERTALGTVYQARTDKLYRFGDDEIQHYEDLRTWYASGERASFILPLMAGGENIGVMHLGSKVSREETFGESHLILRRMAQLVAGAVQNSRLFRQAVTLQVLNLSVVQSIQQGIIVLDNSGRVVSINDFMRLRYGWTSDAVQEDLFAYRPELSEFLKEDMRDVLENGVQHERINQSSTDNNGASVVRNFYMYPLRYDNNVRGAVILVEDVTERAELEKAMETRANQLAALTEVSTRISASLEREEVIALALEEMGWIIPFDTMSIWRRNGSLMAVEGISENGERLEPTDTRIRFKEIERVRQVVDTQRVVTYTDPKLLPQEGLPGDATCRSWLGVPLVNQGHVVGMMMLAKHEADFYEKRAEQYVALAFASQVAIALANADLFEQTFDRTNELGTLLEAAQATSMNLDLDSVFKTVVDLMFNALDMDNCIIMILDDVDNALDVQVDINRHGDDSKALAKDERIDLAKYPAKADSLKLREVIVIADSPDGDKTKYAEEMAELAARGYGARMLVPLVISDQSIGLIQLEQISNNEQTLTQQKVRLARALGSQVAVAIENARLSTETTARFEEVLTINALSQAITSTLDLNEMLKIVRDQVPTITKASEVYLALYENKTQDITFPMAVRDGQVIEIPPRKLGNDEVSYILKKRRSLNLGADYFGIDELRRSMSLVNGEGDAKSYMGVPLAVGEEVLGVLAVRDRTRTRAFNVNNENILSTVASQLAAAIQNARLYQQVTNFASELNQLVEARTIELEQERDRLDTLYQITSELARTLDMDSLLERALGMVSKAVGAGDGVILLSDPITDNLYSRASLDRNSLYYDEDEDRQIHPAEELATWLIQNESREPVLVVDDLHEENYWNVDAPNAGKWRSAMAVLLEMNEDPVGVMVLLSEKVGVFSETQLKLLVPAANQVAAAINSADLYQLIRDQAERLGTLLRAEQEEAERSNAILESIADGVLLADAGGLITLFNTAAERILQLPRDQVLGHPISKLTGLYGQAGDVWQRVMQEWSANPHAERATEFEVDRLELGDRIVSLSLSPVYIGDVFLGTVSVFRDITVAVEVDRMKSDFITNVSHEFRTPLTPIKGFADLLLMGAAGTLTDKQVEMLSKIKSNVERLSVLVNDVLDISKLDSGMFEMKMQQVDLHEIVPSVVERVSSRAHNVKKRMKTSVEVEDNVPLVRADRDKLIQIINNIVDNAFNYTRLNGRIDVHVSYQNRNNSVLISVADSGVGIAEEFRESVWRRFERYEPHALELDVAGTGLGLPLVRELVTRHNGHIWFESEINVGTTFYVELPVEQPTYVTSTSELPQVTPTIGD